MKVMYYFSRRITWLIAIVVCFFALLDAKGQDSLQLDLLREAYEKNSSELLFDFFDRWSAEIQSNEEEGEAKDLYIAEAHQVFKAFYQPLKLKEIGYGSDMYDDSPYFIVQGKLRKISLAEQIVIPEEEDSFLVADQIIFNPDMTRAVVQWECYYHGGDAVLVKQDGEWVIVGCRRIWIE